MLQMPPFLSCLVIPYPSLNFRSKLTLRRILLSSNYSFEFTQVILIDLMASQVIYKRCNVTLANGISLLLYVFSAGYDVVVAIDIDVEKVPHRLLLHFATLQVFRRDIVLLQAKYEILTACSSPYPEFQRCVRGESAGVHLLKSCHLSFVLHL